MPLPLDHFGRLRPRAGEVFVERDEQPETYGEGLIILTDSYRIGMKSALGTVRAVGPTMSRRLQPGVRVLISAGVARCIKFGEHDERTLYVCEPSQLYAVVETEEAAKVEELGEAEAGRFPFQSERALHARERVADEGVEKRSGR